MKKNKKEELQIALVQSEYDPLDINSVLKYISWSEGADIVCFPEAFSAGRSIEKTSQFLKTVNQQRKEIIKSVCSFLIKPGRQNELLATKKLYVRLKLNLGTTKRILCLYQD